MTYTKRRTFREGGEVAQAKNFSTRARSVAAIAIASAAALGLSGCGSSGSLGTAFIVNDQSFSERDLTRTIDQWADLSGVDVPRDQMVEYLVQTDLRLQAADDLGVALSDEDVISTLDGVLAEQDTDLTADQVILPVREMFRDLLLINTVRSGAIPTDQIAALDQFISDSTVTLNPRYGTWSDGALQAPGDLGDAIAGTVSEAVPAG